MTILIFILVLTGLIVIHELGHFLTAKAFGIKVDEFAVGFPPRLFSVKWGETRYSLNLLLLGGYVRIAGEQGGVEPGQADPNTFVSKSRWTQSAVTVAGIAANFIAAWLLLSLMYGVGTPAVVDASQGGQVKDPHTTILSVAPNSPAEKAGIKAGDVIASIQTGTATMATSTTADGVQQFIGAHADQSMVIAVSRAGKEQIFVARPEAGVLPDEPARKVLGIDLADVGTLKLPFFSALLAGGRMTWDETVLIVEGLGGFFGNLFSGHPDFSQVAGPVGIAEAGASAVAAGWGTLLLFAAFISINLGIINVLPIPGLDGGRLALIAAEGAIKRPLPVQAYNWFSGVGLALLVGLMVLVTYHDIVRLF